MAGDEFFYSPTPDNEGYFGGEGPQTAPYQWGQKGRALHNSHYVPGTSGAELDVARYRQMGAGAMSGATLDQTQSNAARGEQVYALGQTRDAMGLARGAAYGNAPSAAELYGRRMIDDSINAQMAMAGSAQGGPTAMGAAQRQAAFQGAQMQQSGMRDLAALRADEMARAREQYLGAAGSYAGQAGAMRGQDLNAASTQAGLDNAALDRAQQNQQYYEQLAWNTNKQAQDAAIQRARDDSEAWARQRGLKMQDEQNERDWWKSLASFGGGFIGGMVSDVRAKEEIGPIGEGGIVRVNPYGDTSGISRDNPYAPQAPQAPKVEAQPAGVSILRGLAGAFSGFGGAHAGAYMPRGASFSDAQTKYIVSSEEAKDVVPLTNLPGKDLHVGDDGRAFYVANAEPTYTGASLSGPTPRYSAPAYVPEAKAKASRTEKSRAMTPDELRRAADALERDMRGTHEARMAMGPSVDPVADANRAQASSAYVYKPGFAEASGQAPGEMNVGPMAQTMAADPVASTAVKQDPATGMLYLDAAKLQKVQSAGIASLQRQIDELRARGG